MLKMKQYKIDIVGPNREFSGQKFSIYCRTIKKADAYASAVSDRIFKIQLLSIYDSFTLSAI